MDPVLITQEVPVQPHGVLYWMGFVFRAAWRPFAGWVCALILLANGVILPIARLRGFTFEPLDYRAMAVFVGALVALAGMRSYEKTNNSQDNTDGG